jgi:hypothetical protein
VSLGVLVFDRHRKRMMARFLDLTSREVLVPGDGVSRRAFIPDGCRGFQAALDVVRLGLRGDRGHHAMLRAE